MCCFSRPIRHVSATRIFARTLDGGRQALAYSMNLEIDDEVAMVLPLPVVPGGSEEAVEFVDLSGHPQLFRDLDAAFPERPRATGMLAPAPAVRARLPVHDVGSFEASYVPSPDDFDRLDPRFRLPEVVLSKHAAYSDWGFAVFRLAPKRSWLGKLAPQTVHPMAFRFASRKPRAVFFPTLHVHDGRLPATARFDHALYYQSGDAVLTRTCAWRASDEPLSAKLEARARGILQGGAHVYRRHVAGDLPNEDIWLEPPRCSDARVLDGRGDRWAFELHATAAYYNVLDDARSRAWAESARTGLDHLSAGLHRGLSDLTAARAAEWDLAELRPDLVELWLSSDQLYMPVMDPMPRVAAPGTVGPFRVRFGVAGERVEHQSITLAFARVPSETTVEAVRRELAKLLDRIAGGG